MAPHRNVELKARDADPEKTLAAALAHGAEDQGVLTQRDTYFAAREGRLKLREERRGDGPWSATLIDYSRADDPQARTSAYHLVDVADPGALKVALDASLGTTIVVEKFRRLLLWQDVRIHLDEVDGLGTFVELEAVAPEGSDLSAEHRKVAELRQVLDIADDDVEATGYASLLLASGAMSHKFWPLSKLRAHEAAGVEHIFSPAHAKADLDRLDWMKAGDHARVLNAMPEFLQYKPEANFGHYLMMAAAMGEADFSAPGRLYSEYENSIGTGQVHIWFDRPGDGWQARRKAAQ